MVYPALILNLLVHIDAITNKNAWQGVLSAVQVCQAWRALKPAFLYSIPCIICTHAQGAGCLTLTCFSGIQANLLEERDPGVLLAIVTLLLGICSRSYEGMAAQRFSDVPSLQLHENMTERLAATAAGRQERYPGVFKLSGIFRTADRCT